MIVISRQKLGQFNIGENLHQHHLFNRLKNTADREFEYEFQTIRVNNFGRIDLISTKERSYKDISIGMTFKEIVILGHVLLYDEFDQVFYLKNTQGICLEKDFENLSFNSLMESKIQYLTIYDINADKELWELLTRDFVEIDTNFLKIILSENTR